MSFIAVGINHQTAPVAIRERVAFTPSLLVKALKDFSANNQHDQLVILSTCNRTELYATCTSGDAETLAQWLAQVNQIDYQELREYLYFHHQQAAINHLINVACGLDSLILGEPQILGQVKQAFVEAKHVGTVKSEFEHIFQKSFAVAKKVRSQTEIGANAVSVAFAAVQLAKQIFSKLAKTKIMLIGAGETIELVAKHLADSKVSKITVANRTLRNAQQVVESLQTKADAITISEIPEYLADADIVISSTASALPILGKGAVASALKARKYKPMLMIDLAVPRDIEDQVAELNDAYLYTVDDLQVIVAENVANRERAAEQAKQIIVEHAKDLHTWHTQSDKVDLIKSYREQAEQTRLQLEQRALARLAQGEDAQEVLQEFSKKLAQAMMHSPTKALQKAIAEPDKLGLTLFEETIADQQEKK